MERSPTEENHLQFIYKTEVHGVPPDSHGRRGSGNYENSHQVFKYEGVNIQEDCGSTLMAVPAKPVGSIYLLQ